MVQNSYEFALAAVRIIKEQVAKQLVDGIRYTPIGEYYEMSQFEGEIETWLTYLEPAEKSLYDHVVYDSKIERDFALALERMAPVKLYVKLPFWFKVATPIGEYNPDWAIVWEERDAFGEATGRDLLYLVRETKGTTSLAELRPDEQYKVRCATKHFRELGADYGMVKTAGELPGGVVPA